MKKVVKEVICQCLPKAMSQIGKSNDGQDIYFCRVHSKIRKLPPTKEGK